MWMPAGTFWTQPKGEVHIISASGSNNVALVEIDNEPYLVLPIDKAFNSGKRPVNLDASNVVWVVPQGMQDSAHTPKIAYLWGSLEDGDSNGTFIKLPAGFIGKINSLRSTFRAVVIKSQAQYKMSDTDVKTLDPGSYFSSKGESTHQISSKADEESIIYVHTNGKYEVIPVTPF